MDGVVNREFEASQSTNKMSFKDMVTSKYSPEYFNGSWVSDTEIVYPDQVSNNISGIECEKIPILGLLTEKL